MLASICQSNVPALLGSPEERNASEQHCRGAVLGHRHAGKTGIASCITERAQLYIS